MRRRRRRAVLWTVVLFALLVWAVLVASTLGAARIPVQITAGVLLDTAGVHTAWAAEASGAQAEIVRAIRLPRIFTAVLLARRWPWLAR